jgi:hypothetical protein
MLVFIAAFVGQWAIGAIIGHWPVTPDGNYALAGYRTSFFIMLAIQAMTLLWFFVASRMIRTREIN